MPIMYQYNRYHTQHTVILELIVIDFGNKLINNTSIVAVRGIKIENFVPVD